MMKTFVILSALVAIAYAKPSGALFAAAPAPIVTASSSQYYHRLSSGLAAYVAAPAAYVAPASPYVAAAPYVAPASPYVAAAPYVAPASPYVAAPYVAAPAPYVAASPAIVAV